MRIASGSFLSSALMIRSRMVGLRIMISLVGTRCTPGLMLGRSFWATMAFRLKASACRRALCMSAGNRSRMRPVVLGALLAWMVPKTRWPVSAAVLNEVGADGALVVDEGVGGSAPAGLLEDAQQPLGHGGPHQLLHVVLRQ